MRLIINADDFGLSKSITDGIIDGILDGYITSTTIMANMDYAEYNSKVFYELLLFAFENDKNNEYYTDYEKEELKILYREILDLN